MRGFAVTLGIGLTDTIHFMMHYRRRTRVLGDNVQSAVQTTIREIGRPLVMTSLVHVAGFAIFLIETTIAARAVRVRSELLQHTVDEGG